MERGLIFEHIELMLDAAASPTQNLIITPKRHIYFALLIRIYVFARAFPLIRIEIWLNSWVSVDLNLKSSA